MNKKCLYFLSVIVLLVLLVFFFFNEPSKKAVKQEKKHEEVQATKSEPEPSRPLEKTKKWEKGRNAIGPQVYKTYPMVAKIAHIPDGKSILYVAQQGYPSVLTVLDAETMAILDVKEMTETNAIWAIDVGEDGSAWVGTTPSEQLYHYEPLTKKWTNYGKMTIEKNTMIGGIDYNDSNQKVYGATSYEGGVFVFEKGKVKNLGQTVNGKKYGRSIAYDEKRGNIIVGLGSKAELISWNEQTHQKRDILPKEYKEQQYVYDLNIVDDLLFSKLSPEQRIVVIDLNDFSQVDSFEVSSRGVSPLSPIGHFVYYTYKASIYEYSLESKKSTEIYKGLPSEKSSITLGFVGKKLLGMQGNSGDYFTYNLLTKEFESGLLPLPKQPIEIHSLHQGIKDTVISSGFVSGGIGIYDTKTNEQQFFTNVGQVESAAISNGKMYFGSYPQAKIWEYDPAQKTSKDFELPVKEIAQGELQNSHQDRPTAMAGVEELHALYIGTFPKSGYVGGNFLIYDTKKNTYQHFPNWIENQSIVSLVYTQESKKLYGATSIYGGTGNQTPTKEAKIFTLTPSENKTTPMFLSFPIKGIRTFEGLLYDKGMLWGFADGYVFSYDEKTKEFKTKKVAENVSGYINQTSMVKGKDGLLYGNVNRMLIQLHPESMDVTILRNENDVEALVADKTGNLFYKTNSVLYRYEP